MQSTEDIIAERGSVYGDFTAGVVCEAAIMHILNLHCTRNTGRVLSDVDQVIVSKIIMKLVRIAANVTYLDSWADVAGYAKLAEAHYIKQEKENAQS